MRPECASACSGYRWALPRSPLSGRAGERLGRAAGASLEFMDFRDYTPGDDLRHVDWRSFARTDQLKMRLFREEVSPSADVVCDLSPSMAVTPQKERAARDLAGAACEWTQRGGGVAKRFVCGAATFADEEAAAFDAPADGRVLPAIPLRARSLRIVVSDFLTPEDPAPQIRRLAAGASHLWVVQLLDPWELAPEAEGAVALVDCETGDTRDLVLDARTVAAYRERLQRLTRAVERATSAVGGTYALVAAGAPDTMFRRGLLPRGMIEPV